MKKKNHNGIIALGIITLLFIIAIIYSSSNQLSTTTLGDPTGIRVQKGFSFNTITECNSIFPEGECRTTSYTNKANGLTATARPILHTRNQLYGKTPAYYEEGTPVYLGDIVIDYKCIGSEMRYNIGTETPYKCDDYGCDGTTRSLTRSVTIKAPIERIPAIILQCYDYKVTLGPENTWVSAWSWVSTSYPSIDAKLVTSLPEEPVIEPPVVPPTTPPPVVEPTPTPDPQPGVQLNVWQKILAWFTNLFKK